MSRVRNLTICLLSLSLLSQAAGATSVVTMLGIIPPGDTILYEGESLFFEYSFSVTPTTTADHIGGGSISWNYGNGTELWPLLHGTTLSGAEQGSARYREDGVYQVTAVGSLELHEFDDIHDSVIETVLAPESALSITVLNLAPSVDVAPSDVVVDVGEWFPFFVRGVDQGADDILTIAWDLDEDGVFDDLVESGGFELGGAVFLESSGGHSFSTPGEHTISYRIQDDELDFVSGSFNITVVPEPSAGCLIVLGLAGLAVRGRGWARGA